MNLGVDRSLGQEDAADAVERTDPLGRPYRGAADLLHQKEDAVPLTPRALVPPSHWQL